jgi:NTP pyrophosphatase (non-canonical NTP hydrolase)
MSYETFVQRLAAPIHPERVPASALRRILVQALYDLPLLDEVKKALFVGKASPSVDNLCRDYALVSRPDDYDGVPEQLLHGILGLRTEADELLKLVHDALAHDLPIDRRKVIDEAGDCLFYLVLLLAAVRSDLPEAIERNIAKLKARFPDGYSDAVAAGPKDRVAEAAAQWGSA